MAKKHFDEYYFNIQATYQEMHLILNQLIDRLDSGEVDEEQVENFKAAMLPIVNNYGMMTQVKLMLDTPSKKKKLDKWKQQNKKFFDQADKNFEASAIEKIHNESIQKLKDIVE